MSGRRLVGELLRNWYRPGWWRETALPYGVDSVTTSYGSYMNERGCDFFTENWDNLVILDACRFDMFDTHHDLPGELNHRYSKGSATHEFLQRTFGNRTAHDTVYVTANPMYLVERWVGTDLRGTFHDVVDVWDSGWDAELGTVPPDAVVDAAREAHRRYPHKRLIVHFMQPHYPFIGETARESLGEQGSIDTARDRARGIEANTGRDIWDRLRDGDISETLVWETYVENLKVVLPHVETLLASFDERTVVTSDHGNLLGERIRPVPVRRYGHPDRVHVPELVDVPWLVVEGDERKSIVEERPTDRGATNDETVTDRLEHLGYR